MKALALSITLAAMPVVAFAQANPPNGSLHLQSPFTTCLACPVATKIITTTDRLAAQIWDLTNSDMAVMMAIFVAVYFAYWTLRTLSNMLPQMKDKYDTSGIYGVIFRSIISGAFLGGASTAAGFTYVKTFFVDVLVYYPIALARDLLNAQNLATLTAQTAAYCAGTDPLACVLSATQDSLSWIVVAAYNSMDASFSLPSLFPGGGLISSGANFSILNWLGSLYLLFVSGKSLIGIPTSILSYALPAYGFICFSGLLACLWVWPSFRRIPTGAVAYMIEHGAFFVSLAIVAVLLPVIASSVLEMVNANYTSFDQFFQAINQRQIDLVPWKLEFWVLLFFVQAIAEFIEAAKRTANRVFSLLSSGDAS